MIGLRYLSRQHALAAGAADMAAAMDDVRATLALLRAGQAGMVAEAVLPRGPDPRDAAYALPGFVGGDYDAVGLKWAVHRAGPTGELPSITNLTLINRRSDGRPLGLVESAVLTRQRTAAVSALVLQTLLPHPPRAMALLGAGAQAQVHSTMLREVFPALQDIRIWARDPQARDAFAESHGLHAAPTLQDAVDGTDAVLACTAADRPFIGPDCVAPGRMILQVGFNEVRFSAIEASQVVVVDAWGEFAERSAKSLFQMYRAGRFSPDCVAADLSAVLLDGWRPPPGASLYFSSFGLNVFDIALAARLLRTAEARGIGTQLSLL